MLYVAHVLPTQGLSVLPHICINPFSLAFSSSGHLRIFSPNALRPIHTQLSTQLNSTQKKKMHPTTFLPYLAVIMQVTAGFQCHSAPASSKFMDAVVVGGGAPFCCYKITRDFADGGGYLEEESCASVFFYARLGGLCCDAICWDFGDLMGFWWAVCWDFGLRWLKCCNLKMVSLSACRRHANICVHCLNRSVGVPASKWQRGI